MVPAREGVVGTISNYHRKGWLQKRRNKHSPCGREGALDEWTSEEPQNHRKFMTHTTMHNMKHGDAWLAIGNTWHTCTEVPRGAGTIAAK